MSAPSTALTPAALLVLLGTIAIWAAFATGGFTVDSVSQYTAYEVDHDDELELTSLEDGEERRSQSVNVDDRIVCLPTATWECTLFREAAEENTTVEGMPGDYWYAYLDDEFYRIQESDPFELEFDPVDADEAISFLATDANQLSSDERETLEDGQTRSTETFTHTNELVEHDDGYAVILQTGQKSYSGWAASTCSSSGDDFCDPADRTRTASVAQSGFLAVAGLIGVVRGGSSLIRHVRGAREH